MRRAFQITIIILLALGVFACAPATPGVQEPTVAPSPAPTDGYYPLTTRTGIEEIDRILQALETGDEEALRSLIQFTEAECTQAEGLGGPPKCRAGEAEGTLVEVLPSIGSEGSFLRRDEIANWPGVAAAGIYAVYEVNAAAVTSEQYYPIGKYALMLAGKEPHLPVVLRIDNGGIVRVDYPAVNTPDGLKTILESEAATVILAPPGQ